MARNKQCEATVKTEVSPNFGKQCGRLAVNGADFCAMHGGVEQSKDRETIRKRIDRPGQKCTAKRRDGQPCNGYAIHGSMVCKTHGGTLPSVREKAKQRIQEMILPAWDELRKIMLKETTSDADKLRAVSILLDRAGYGPRSELAVEHEVKPWEGLVNGVLRNVPDNDDGDIVDAEIVEDEPRPPSDEDVGRAVDEYVAEYMAEYPRREEEAEPVPDNVRKIWSRPNPPAHLR